MYLITGVNKYGKEKEYRKNFENTMPQISQFDENYTATEPGCSMNPVQEESEVNYTKA